MRNITYAIGEGSVFARCGDKVAFPVLEYGKMTPQNGFKESYKIEECSVFDLVGNTWDSLLWTKKIPIQIKNLYRKHFGFKPLKEVKK
jgi:hypothetical protein